MNTRSPQLGRPARKSSGSRGAAPASAASLPWVPQMFMLYAALAVIGLVVFIVGYSIVNSETTYNDQDTGIILAIAGVIVANGAGASLLLVGRRAVTARRVGVLGAVPALAAASGVSAPSSSLTLVGGEGLKHYHRADCAMAADRDWASAERADHERAGRTPCGVCRP